MGRVVRRKRARKRLAAKRKNVAFTRPPVTTITGPKPTLRRILYIVAAIIELWFSIVAAILVTFFRLLSALLTILQVIFEMLDNFKLM